MGRRRDLSPEERALWNKVAGTTRRLSGEPDSEGAPDESEAVAEPADRGDDKPRSAPPATAPPVNAPPVNTRVDRPAGRPAPPPANLDRRTEQRLRRGQLEVDARLDLHGMTQNAAHAALRRFLVVAQQNGSRLVLVITGKGGSVFEREQRTFGEEPRGVLRRQVPQWLSSAEFTPFVGGFHQAHLRHGGEGALYIQVRRAKI